MNQKLTRQNLFNLAARCLAEPSPSVKVALTRLTAALWTDGQLDSVPPAQWQPLQTPGRPDQPHLVSARELPKRKITDPAGLASLIHAVAHIEFNAINLAWDAVQRFPHMPEAFHADWLQVASEEAEHFVLMQERLQLLGHEYGDLPAHDGLWDMARRTAADVLERMALVPRVLEARGLDVTPGMIERLRRIGDHDSADRLALILRDEIGHVAIGSRWFHQLCKERGLEPRSTSLALIQRHLRGEVRCPLNRADRLKAGFDESELTELESLCARGLKA
ncbi:MAG: ferritin-like domain-containing protein [Lamprobacter sp.]|uniref:ferritin-like domain-containing protein n=1 Tax=Lamprobacter sp. TaxID=3100796 RepID=UPI002B25FFB1|nr:ferritin-like domain-containing protein [Lamprobacter sp.]MEA3638971.1 ferritin-like domain-containing protein [Lamprobacter sp.]